MIKAQEDLDFLELQAINQYVYAIKHILIAKQEVQAQYKKQTATLEEMIAFTVKFTVRAFRNLEGARSLYLKLKSKHRDKELKKYFAKVLKSIDNLNESTDELISSQFMRNYEGLFVFAPYEDQIREMFHRAKGVTAYIVKKTITETIKELYDLEDEGFQCAE